ncbi:MAG: MFS transporter [Chlamydiae bacterium]|nr:MFS transporter [Chlamydiota bacterium]
MVLFNGRNSFQFLNAAQFLGALNDNVFKLLVVFFLINVKGIEEANTILATTGAVFVIPFLIFSSAFGVLADRISKRSIIVGTKVVEVIIVSLSFVAIYFQSEMGLFALLFFLSAQSAAFGPSKYGIVPELVSPEYVSKANGYLSAFTYLAIIFGTFLAAFLTDISHKKFFIVAIASEIIAIGCLISTLGIKKTEAKGSKKRINPFFFYEIYKTLSIASKKRHLLLAVFGSAYFLFIGGFTQLNTIPFGIQALNLSEVGGGYLFLSTAVGIAIGSYLAGLISKDKVEIGLACIASFCLSLFMILLGVFASSLSIVIIMLILLGVFGGMFLVPLDSFIQIFSPDKKRGRIIAASNFLSFCGVLIASFFLYVFGGKLKLSAANCFILIGAITFLFAVFITGRMAEPFFSFVARKFLLKFYKVDLANLPPPSSILILTKRRFKDLVLLYAFFPHLKILTIGKKFKTFPFVNNLFNSIYLIEQKKEKESSLKNLYIKLIKVKRRINYCCLYLEKDFDKEVIQKTLSIEPFKPLCENLYWIYIEKKKKNYRFYFSK